jgi:hypothetical protein
VGTSTTEVFMKKKASTKTADTNTSIFEVPANEPVLDAVGTCPVCGGEVIMDGDSFYCRFVFVGKCNFELRRRSFMLWGEKRKLSKFGIQVLLKQRKIPLENLISPYKSQGCALFNAYGVLQEEDKRWGITVVEDV